jgi:hypothetical protein
MNRRVLDRAIIDYKRNIYDLTPMEELEEEDDILNLEAEEKRESTINGNEEVIEATEDSTSNERPIKRRRGDADETPV